VEMIIDDNAGGNGNGFLDPGETATISFGLLNNGHSTAYETTVACSTNSAYVSPSYSSADIGKLEPGINKYANFQISVDEDTPLGQEVAFDILATSGAYTSSETYWTSVGMLVEDWETGGFTSFNWQFAGDAPWIICTSEPYEGTYCLQSGEIADGQESELFITFDVLASGDLSFYRKVSSEAEWDYLRFYIDYTLMGEWSGELNWEMASYPVTQGLHTFHWVYEKDDWTSTGEDCAWVDYIVFPPVDVTTGLNQHPGFENGFTLNLRPNPARSNLIIDYTLEASTEVNIIIYDLLGHRVMDVMSNSRHQAGIYNHQIDISGIMPGIYLCRIITDEGSQSKKLIIQ
jgi:hypothetical protein